MYENINKLVYATTALLLLFMLANVFVGVIFRYVFRSALFWTEELARYMMIWCAYLAMGMVVRDEDNVKVVFAVNLLPVKARGVINVLTQLIVGIFLVIMFWGSVKHMRILRLQTSPALGVSMVWPYLSVTIGSALMLIENVRLMFLYATGKKAA
ncbi:MAG TPA: TRAP transporter small permease [Tepidimicrobium sp.]|nr:TRAP transporter small permease [Tepidimicrobium sp.]